jgi:6-pyruvoyltetrahydropterin/6-carboxytetrahydropterin synthase
MMKRVPARQPASQRPSPVPGAVATTRIGRTYRFEAAHRLPHLPDGHKCRNLHGHTYRVCIVMQGRLDGRGFVKDFAEIDADVCPLIELVDHRVLNDVEGLENPTAEVIAAWFLERIADCESVRVYENDDCWAEVEAGAQ